MSDTMKEIKSRLGSKPATVIRAEELEALREEIYSEAIENHRKEIERQSMSAINKCLPYGLIEFSHPNTAMAGFQPSVDDLAEWALHLKRKIDCLENNNEQNN